METMFYNCHKTETKGTGAVKFHNSVSCSFALTIVTRLEPVQNNSAKNEHLVKVRRASFSTMKPLETYFSHISDKNP